MNTMAPLYLATLILLQSPASRHDQISVECSPLREDAALLCRVAADAQRDVNDAEEFIGSGDVGNAISRLDDARKKYERLIGATNRTEVERLVEALVRYAVVTISVFASLSLEGDLLALSQAELRLRTGHQFLVKVLSRLPALEQRPEIAAATADLTQRLVTVLDNLGELEVTHAVAKHREGLTARVDAFGAATDFYDEAAQHFAEAHALAPNTNIYLVRRLDAILARSDLLASQARRSRPDAARACVGYRQARTVVEDFQRERPTQWRAQHEFRRQHERANKGVQTCTRPQLVLGGALLGIGVATAVLSAGLYAQYVQACDFDAATHACAGILAPTPESDRYRAQFQAAIVLAAAGGMLTVSGGAILIHGLVQRRRSHQARLLITPTFSRRFQGAAIRLHF